MDCVSGNTSTLIRPMGKNGNIEVTDLLERRYTREHYEKHNIRLYWFSSGLCIYVLWNFLSKKGGDVIPESVLKNCVTVRETLISQSVKHTVSRKSFVSFENMYQHASQKKLRSKARHDTDRPTPAARSWWHCILWLPWYYEACRFDSLWEPGKSASCYYRVHIIRIITDLSHLWFFRR